MDIPDSFLEKFHQPLRATQLGIVRPIKTYRARKTPSTKERGSLHVPSSIKRHIEEFDDVIPPPLPFKRQHRPKCQVFTSLDIISARMMQFAQAPCCGNHCFGDFTLFTVGSHTNIH